LRRAFLLVLGLKPYLLTAAEGMPVAWCLASLKLGEREVAQELLGHAMDGGALRRGMIVPAGGPRQEDPAMTTPSFDHFRPVLEGLLQGRTSARAPAGARFPVQDERHIQRPRRRA
jgi:hypothetical protein